jgi:regulator of sigma D
LVKIKIKELKEKIMNKLDTNDKVFINKCKKVQKGKMTLEELIATLKFRFYIPLTTKMAVADLVTLIISNKTDTKLVEEIFETNYIAPTVSEILQDYELYKFMFMISQYIGVQISVENCETEVYDLIHEIGLYDYIVEKSKGDFTKFEKIIDDMTGIGYYALTNSINQIFNDLPTQEKLNEFKKAFESIDKEQLEAMRDIAYFNDPMLKEVSKALKVTTMEEVKSENKDK